ncbi:MAG: ribosome maturation factor RimP [Acidimicrobiales bacterium]
MAKTDIVRDMVEPLATAAGAFVYDVTFNGGKLTVALNRREGIDLDTLADISRELGQQLEERDVIAGSYTLEVGSPGLERVLRTPEHHQGAIGESVTIRTTPETEGDRRIRGTISAADDAGFTVQIEDDADRPTGEERTLAYDEVERARTTFSWGPAPKPGNKPGAAKNKNTKKPNKKAPST